LTVLLEYMTALLEYLVLQCRETTLPIFTCSLCDIFLQFNEGRFSFINCTKSVWIMFKVASYTHAMGLHYEKFLKGEGVLAPCSLPPNLPLSVFRQLKQLGCMALLSLYMGSPFIIILSKKSLQTKFTNKYTKIDFSTRVWGLFISTSA